VLAFCGLRLPARKCSTHDIAQTRFADTSEITNLKKITWKKHYMKNKSKFYRKIIAVMGIALLAVGITRTSRADDGRDFLYVGDAGDNTVQRFDAKTGVYQGIFVAQDSSGTTLGEFINGPRGLIFNHHGDLLLANQNVGGVNAPNGTILKYDGKTGAFLDVLVNFTDPNSPVAPRGIVLGDFLFVAI
jgi:hypothetical protein